jgi:hypothetical protein
MARTSQKARKSTGGIVPRLNLSRAAPPLGNIQLTTKATSSATSSAAPLATSSANSKLAQVGEVLASTHDGYCYICVNGGDLTECDKCSRVMCSEHFDLPAGGAVAVRDALFICIACHLEVCSNEPVPYFVSGFIICHFLWHIYIRLNTVVRAFIHQIPILSNQWSNGPPFLHTLF